MNASEYPWIEDGPRNGPKALSVLGGFSIIRREVTLHNGSYDLRWAWFETQDLAEAQLREVAASVPHVFNRLSIIREADSRVVHIGTALKQ